MHCSTNRASRLNLTCERLGLANARSYLRQEETIKVADDGAFWIRPYSEEPVPIGTGEPSLDAVAVTLRTNSDDIVRKSKLKRAADCEAIYPCVSLEEQHFDLVDWGIRILRPYLQGVTRPTSIKNRQLVPELPSSQESSRERDRLLRRYAKLAVKEDDGDVSACLLLEIIAETALCGRLERSGILSEVYDGLQALMQGKNVPASKVAEWCRTLEQTADIGGSPQSPAALHALAQETWEFYARVLGLEPTVNSNAESGSKAAPQKNPWTEYQYWSFAVAKLVFHDLASDQWDTALRGRGMGLGSKYLSGQDVALLRGLKLPWTKRPA